MSAAKVEVWLVKDVFGEYVRYYNPTGHVMVFTKDRDEAMRTTDSRYAYEVAGIARRIYHRKFMGIDLCN